jgi:hypothetical protein
LLAQTAEYVLLRIFGEMQSQGICGVRSNSIAKYTYVSVSYRYGRRWPAKHIPGTVSANRRSTMNAIVPPNPASRWFRTSTDRIAFPMMPEKYVKRSRVEAPCCAASSDRNYAYS